MNYRVEAVDRQGVLAGVFEDVPRLEATREQPGGAGRIRGLVIGGAPRLGVGYEVRVWVDGALFTAGRVTSVAPCWGDTRRLVLGRYVNAHDVVEFEAVHETERLNGEAALSFRGARVDAMARGILDAVAGPLRYWVSHESYPDGAEREWAKFMGRRHAASELEIGEAAPGNWAGPGRIDASGAYAKSGDVIAGLAVDGAAWPDLRLLMLDCEEVERNARAMARHPEVAAWTDAAYERSAYGVQARASRDALQAMLAANGLDHIELNPYRDGAGAYGGRVDAWGRYVGLAYGNELCLNAAMVELGHAGAALLDGGAALDPSMRLKDFYSYEGSHEDSIEEAPETLARFDAQGGAFETIAAVAYAAGATWSVDARGGLRLRTADRPDRVVYYDPAEMSLSLGATLDGLVNTINFTGHPATGPFERRYAREASVAAFGTAEAEYALLPVTREEDAEKFAEGMLDDLAYPAPRGELILHRGDASFDVGQLIEVRGEAPGRLDAPVAGEWGGRFAGRMAARVEAVTHLLAGRRLRTTLRLGPPLRSVERPLAMTVRGQESLEAAYVFGLDDAETGLDAPLRLDG